MRVEKIGGATLYLGDAREVLINPLEAGLGVTDAPYKLTTGGVSKSSKTMSGIFAMHNYANDGELVMCSVEWPEVMDLMFKHLKADADLYAMANDKQMFPAYQAAIKAGFKHHNVLPWDKVTPTANRWYMKHFEFTLYFWKGQAKTINDPSSKQGARLNQKDVTDHPTEKPVQLMRHYITNSSQRGDTVFDPFMGSGTTGVAALQAGRRFVGCEINPKFFDAACWRCESALNQPDMFMETA